MTPPLRPTAPAIAEALGTFLLVLIGPGAVMISAATHALDAIGVSLAFGGIVAIVVASLGPLSGAHINPAVTLGLWSVGKFPGRSVAPYLLAQCAGAILASYVLLAILGPVGHLGATVPAISTGRAFAVEAGYTAVLGLAIAAAGDSSSGSKHLGPLILGGTVFLGALVTGPLTGGSFNPARSLGPAVAGGGWTAHWIYWIAPCLGMVTAMWGYRWLTSIPAIKPAD